MTTTNNHTVDRDLIATVISLFAAKSGHDVVIRAEEEGLIPDLWDSVSELGLPLVGIDESAGGSGGTLLDLLAILHAAGQHSVPLPLSETHLAAWLLSEAGQQVSDGPMTVVPGTPKDTLTLADGVVSGRAYDVPWARGVDRIVALVDDPSGAPYIVTIDPGACEITPGTDLAGQPRDVIEVKDLAVQAVSSPVDRDGLLLRGALVTAAKMAGALEATATLTRGYTEERVQFGRPISKFQAVQQHVVTLFQMATMASLNVSRAGRTAMDGSASFEICALKQVVDKNASIAIRAAHQAHGAFGMTQEYGLQQLTRRLNTWRSEFGDELELASRIGKAISHAGKLEHVIVGGSAVLEV